MITSYQHDEKGKREDVHRPSAIVPADYELAAPIEGVPWWKSGPYIDYGTVAGHCDHCGHALRYAVRYVYKPTGQIVTFGQDCDDLVGTAKDRSGYEWDKLRKRAANAAREAREAMAKDERKVQFIAAYPDVVEYIEELDLNHERSGFVLDVVRFYKTQGYMTDNQAAAIKRVIKSREEYAMKRLLQPTPTTPLAEGRYQIEGTILSHKYTQSDYGTQHKMLVMLDNGNKVYGTMPASIDEKIGDDPKDKRVKFVAKVEVSKDDEHFGFYSRPANGQVDGRN